MKYCFIFLFSLLNISPITTQGEMQKDIQSEEVRFQNKDLTLGALWYTPPGDGPFPVVVFIRGSGPSTRESYWAHAFRDILLEEGVAVLIPDKRGCDGSEGDWRTADFEELATDALAAVEYVRGRHEVQPDAVGLVGLSQGGKIAPVAASQSDEVAFAIDVVGAATNLLEQISWEMYHTFREAGLEDEALLESLTLQVMAEKYVGGDVGWQEYKNVLDAGLESTWAAVAEGFPLTEDSWQWDFFRNIQDFDPLPYWRKTTQPVLIIYGEKDHNAPAVRSVYRLTRAFLEEKHPDWTVRVIPDAGHPLWDPDSPDPHRPVLHPKVVELVRLWIKRVIEL